MKNYWVLGVVGFGLFSQAAFGARPETLVCESSSPKAAGAAKSFTLSNFDKEVPETDMDARADGGFYVDNQVTTFCANNGCDNNYCFVFFTDDLALAAKGKVSVVTGMMNYNNSESQWDSEKEFEENQHSIHFACKISKR